MIVKRDHFIALYLRMIQKKLEKILLEKDFECNMMEEANKAMSKLS